MKILKYAKANLIRIILIKKIDFNKKKSDSNKKKKNFFQPCYIVNFFLSFQQFQGTDRPMGNLAFPSTKPTSNKLYIELAY